MAHVRTDLVTTDDETRLEVAREVGGSPAAVWTLFADPDRWVDWMPGVTGVSCETAAVEPGTTCRLEVFGLVSTGLTVVSKTDDRWVWKLSGFVPLGHRVEPTDDGACQVVFEVPLRVVWYASVLGRALENLNREVLSVETA